METDRHADADRARKLGAAPTFVDTFCGAGGFTWGWVQAGFEPVACIDNDSAALRTHVANFRTAHAAVLNADLGKGSARGVCKQLRLRPGTVTAVIGGPPCQGWSKVGRGKIRSLRGQSRALLDDPRNKLYRRFIEAVAYLRPDVCVMENVPGMLSIEGRNIADLVRDNIQQTGYRCTYALVNAHWFGVPQERHRVIFLAARDGTGITLDASRLRDFAGKFRRERLGLSRPTTVSDALRDLPPIENGTDIEPLAYRMPRGRPSRYSTLMRQRSNGLVTDHVARRYNPQDVRAFAHMKQGMKYYELPLRFKRYRDDIFPDKYKKLILDKEAWTVTAHLSKDCYTHIHPTQARTISVREAARLQSFPDDFLFFGNYGDRFRQIGNAVPPLMAWGIAEFVRDRIQKRARS